MQHAELGSEVHRPAWDTEAEAIRCRSRTVQAQRENGEVAVGTPTMSVWSRHETRRELAHVGTWHWPSECPHGHGTA